MTNPQYGQGYGQQPPQYGQAPQYGQETQYGQQQYGQAPQYGQEAQYGQAPQYGQQFGQQQYGQQQYGAPQQFSAPKPPSQGLPANTGQILALGIGAIGVIMLFCGFLAAYKGESFRGATQTIKVFETQFALGWSLFAVAGVAALLTLLVGATKHYVAAIAALTVVSALITIFVFAGSDVGSSVSKGIGSILLLVLTIVAAIASVLWLLIETGQVKVAPAVGAPAAAAVAEAAAPAAPATPAAPAAPAAPSYEASSFGQPATPSYGSAPSYTPESSYTPEPSYSPESSYTTPTFEETVAASESAAGVSEVSETTVFNVPDSDNDDKK